jgi:hypothetical protein
MMAEQILIQEARIAFPDLFEAVQFQGQGPFQYRCTFLIPPENPAVKHINAAMVKIAADKWGAKAEAILKQIKATSGKCFFVDGDTKAYNGYAGNWAVTATRNQDAGAPLVVGRGGRKDVLSAADGKIYSGCYVNGTIEVWAQDNSFGKAIRATLVNVQFVKNGESFGGAAPANANNLDELAFEDDELDEDI